MTKGNDKIHVAEEDNWDTRQHDDRDQDHVQAKENKEAEPFGMGTIKNELELARLMVTEIETGNLQVNEGGKDNNRCLTIREELNKLFGRKGSQQNQQLSDEMLEQTVRGIESISQNADQLWCYWEKPKMKRIATTITRTMIQRMENREKYFVELAEDQQEMEEDSIAKPHQRNDYKWDLELAYNLEMHLNLKRKRYLSINIVNEEETKEAKEISMQQLESRGLFGRLCIFWKSNVNIHVYAWCDNFIKTRVINGNDKDWEAIFVYDHPDYKKRKELWKDLTFLNNSLVQPRVMIGDFNNVISQDEKFEAFRVGHANCDAVIRRGWSSSGYTSSDHWKNLNRRMHNCKKELTK
ncbi:hypothetical protein Ahy_B07g087786 [Arachis hypogaea]|uniref:Endonuclease/exonuclease/phosphatase domain-containing protein n=1 Tax=Arachis hypogaea TaxID=3818 RepID=A0A444YCY3_ARAHY|nr:hypothetical protein Ahy_B07g087786 [Arachis hypogaea]